MYVCVRACAGSVQNLDSGLWTGPWTGLWTGLWTVLGQLSMAEAKVLGPRDTEQWIYGCTAKKYEYTHKHTHMRVRDKLKCIKQLG